MKRPKRTPVSRRASPARPAAARQPPAKHERDLLAALLDVAGALVVVLDRQGRIVRFNRFCEDLTGYHFAEVEGRPLWDVLLIPEEVAAVRGVLAGLVAGQFPNRHENYWRTKDGGRRLIAWSNTALVGEGGEVRYVIGTGIDVTEQRLAEQALRDSEARYRTLMEQASDGIFVTDQAFRILEVNSRGCEMLGYTREEMLGLVGAGILLSEDLAVQPVRIAEFMQQGSVLSERRVRRKDGSVFSAEINARALPDGRIVGILRDVSERKHAEEALRASEAKYRAILEQASDGIFLADEGMRYTEVNPRACEMLGYGREEVLRLSVRDILPAEDLAANPVRIEELKAGGPVLNERRMRRRDGSIFPVEISARRLPDGRFLGIVRDITERKRVEQALRESEERFRRVFESDMMGMIFGLERGVIADANDYFLRLVGRPRNDLLAGRLRWDVLLPPEHGARLQEAVAAAYEAGAAPPFETELIRSDGVRVPVLVGAAFLGREKKLGVGFALDLTERQRAEQRLAESERYLDRAQKLAHVGTWDADLATEVSTWSEEMARIFGLPPSQHTMSFEDLIPRVHPEDRELVLAQIRRATEQRVTCRYEHRVLRPDGGVRVVEVTCEPVLDATGKPVRLIGSLQDVTERRFLEQQLREAQKLEAIGRLAGGVAHDFNNLLTVILGYAETLLAGLPADDPRHASADQIRQAARRAAALTRQLLAFGRRQVFELRVFDLNGAIAEMREILERLLGEQIEIAFSPGAGHGLVKADRGQIEQVILNLALNARDAMPRGGRLSIETRHVDPPAAEPGRPADVQRGSWLQLTVSDTGVGMDPEVQAHIFEPFYTTKEVGQGSGLGLATVYGIVSQSGGRIEVSSAPGQGATFRVYLPCAGEAATPESASSLAPARGGEETLLLVEDEAAVRELAAEALRRRGYRVLVAADGEEALEAGRRSEGGLHLLVTDVVMPGMNGQALAQRLAAERPGLRVLFISGYSDETFGQRGIGSLPGMFLEKPFTSETLARKVREVLDAPAPGAARG